MHGSLPLKCCSTCTSLSNCKHFSHPKLLRYYMSNVCITLRLDLFIQKWNMYVPSSRKRFPSLFPMLWWCLLPYTRTNSEWNKCCRFEVLVTLKSIHLSEFGSLAARSVLANFPWTIRSFEILSLLFKLCTLLQCFFIHL